MPTEYSIVFDVYGLCDLLHMPTDRYAIMQYWRSTPVAHAGSLPLRPVAVLFFTEPTSRALGSYGRALWT